ncbi:MAG TPA: hypothetical protein PLD68_09790 [Clostridiales bacterium]|nr:hypothetical protein [Clostridiales bacterium]
MIGDFKKSFAQRSIQAREKALAAASKTTMAEAERLADLESAVVSLASAVPKGKKEHVAAVLANMVLLQSITLKDVPAEFKQEVDKALKEKDAAKKPRKEAAK